MGRRWRACLALGLVLFPAARAGAGEAWFELRTPHFELITNAAERYSPGLLFHLEQLRRLFLTQSGAADDRAQPPVRIIAFRSEAEYARYRLDDAADAYYFGAPGRDYIVMPLARAEDYHIGAHEYAHVAIHRAGLQLPLWLSEGLAEVFSTVRFASGQAILGQPDPARLQALTRSQWLPLAEIMTRKNTPGRRDPRGMFYAGSWALTHMLMFSPAYGRRFGALIEKSSEGLSASEILREVYRTSAANLERDLRGWVTRPGLPSVKVNPEGFDPSRPPKPVPLNSFAVDLALADLLLTTGRSEQARAAYLQLENPFPANPDIQAALGRIALSAGRKAEALERFGRAMSLGIRNAKLCYEFAVMAQDAELPQTDVVAALERAVALDAGMDEARYQLAMAYMNAGRFPAALQHLQALRFVPFRRAYAYYSALSYVQNEVGLREESRRSAAEAHRVARTQEEAEHASELAWMAESEIVVQMTSGKSGQLRRISNKGTALENWNPFVEPGDRMERREGEIKEVVCAAGELRIVVGAGQRRITIGVPHPERVQVRPAESAVLEFTCGKQDGPRVLVEYATASDPAGEIAGVLRGIRFLR
jgi:tetratricopeptide (TPR) repeat protein